MVDDSAVCRECKSVCRDCLGVSLGLGWDLGWGHKGCSAATGSSTRP